MEGQTPKTGIPGQNRTSTCTKLITGSGKRKFFLGKWNWWVWQVPGQVNLIWVFQVPLKPSNQLIIHKVRVHAENVNKFLMCTGRLNFYPKFIIFSLKPASLRWVLSISSIVPTWVGCHHHLGWAATCQMLTNIQYWIFEITDGFPLTTSTMSSSPQAGQVGGW